MSFSPPTPPPVPAPPPPIPPQQSPSGSKPGKTIRNPTIIGAKDIGTTPLTLMGPGNLGSSPTGNKFLG